MAASAFLKEPEPVPALDIPESSSTVSVRVIDTTCRIKIQSTFLLVPEIKGFYNFYGPSYSFLVSNGNRHVLFDLGIRKDLEKGAPAVPQRIKANDWGVTAEKDVAEILDDQAANTGVSSKDIEAAIYSHHHWDHTGNLGLFPPSTELVVGPGFKKAQLPGYPTNPDSSLFEPDFENRNMRELQMDFKIGDCDAMDYFGDGSFYLLSTPGHTTGHLCGLARVTTSPPSFVLMGGDAMHHCGEFRPSEYLPLPKNVSPSPFPRFSGGCPGEILQRIHPKESANEAFLDPKPGMNDDEEAAVQTISKLQAFDADERVLTIIAHDMHLIDYLPLFPAKINDWREKELATRTRWVFAKDFEEAVEALG